MIERAIALLQKAGFDLTAREIADIFWLAVHIDESEKPQQQSTVSKPELIETNQPSTPIPEVTQPSADVYLPSSVPSPAKATEKSRAAIPIKIPAAVALRNSLALGRAIRPLMRKVPSQTEKILDEEATVHRFAEDEIGIPVLKGTPERWLELALVVEETSTTDIWKQTITEFQTLLKHHGAFRDVRTWKLKVTNVETRNWTSSRFANSSLQGLANQTKVELFPQNSTGGYASTPHHPNVLIDPRKRRLILLVSDCISPAWREKLIHPVLELWNQSLVTIVQLLPERLWQRTALVAETPVLLSTLNPGVPNIVKIWDEDEIDEFPFPSQNSFSVPIITLEAEPLLIWSRVIAGQGHISTAGFNFSKQTNFDSHPQEQVTREITASELVSRFRATASLQARRLAGLMAAVPVNISVVHLIQQTLLPESAQIHVAEVFMSGLLKRLHDTDDIEYEFVDGVRDLLIDFVPNRKTISVIDKVSEFVAQRLGLSPKEFEARLLIPAEDDLESKIRTFAQLKAQTLRRLGGEYALVAAQLEQRDRTSTQLESRFLEETGILEHFPLELQTFSFEVVTVNARGQITQRETKQAQYFSENLGNNIILDMVAISGGIFLMGSPETEAERNEDESPQHEVTVPPFFMGKYPVTQAQWRAMAALPQVNRELDPNPSYFKGDNLPVEQISWYDAVEFCDRLSKSTERHYRLPSEAEWEYACRGGTTTPFHFGETITPELANYYGKYAYGSGSKGEYRKQTTPVGCFEVGNAFGLFDMHGNALEWCYDKWHQNYEGVPIDGSAWFEYDNDNLYRMLRGGSWYSGPRYCRSADRYRVDADFRYFNVGFRVVLSVART